MCVYFLLYDFFVFCLRFFVSFLLVSFSFFVSVMDGWYFVIELMRLVRVFLRCLKWLLMILFIVDDVCFELVFINVKENE